MHLQILQPAAWFNPHLAAQASGESKIAYDSELDFEQTYKLISITQVLVW